MNDFLVFFKSVPESKEAYFHIAYAINEKDAHNKAYAMLMSDQECRNLNWILDKIEIKD